MGRVILFLYRSSYSNRDVLLPAHLCPLRRSFATLTVCTAQPEGNFQSAEAIKENVVYYNTCSAGRCDKPPSPSSTGGGPTSRASVGKKVKQVISNIRRASPKKLCLSSSGESQAVYSFFGPTIVGAITGSKNHSLICLTH